MEQPGLALIEHGLAHGLHPVSQEPEALMTALQQLAVYFHQVYNISTAFDCPVPVLISSNSAAINLYRIAQEAMNNAVKHGRARHIGLRLAQDSRTIALSITDNGEGFRKTPAGHTGIGLQTMRFRARSLGGTLQVQGGQRQGTVVLCTLPASPSRQSSVTTYESKT